ncbi:MAG: peptidoglycan-binding protein [Oscillospiraceae bacterium]|nr:peptidoglycan-binding protein [Oscillospiraceae bacterium]
MANEKLISTQALIEKFQKALHDHWGYIWGTAGILWTAARQAQLEKTTDADRESGRKYGAKWIGHMVADCSGLFDWAFRELNGIDIFHGSNTIWNSYCTAKGELRKGARTDGKPLKPGTAVFTKKVKKKNGKTTVNRGHIGLYIGDGWVIEASGTINGVIKSRITISKWVEWGELRGVNYETADVDTPADPEENMTRGTIRKGDKGPVVRYAQELLQKAGYQLPKYGADGSYGAETVAAVKAFQKAAGLQQDGVIGPKTWAALEADKKPSLFTVTIEHLSAPEAEALVAKYKTATMAEEG